MSINFQVRRDKKLKDVAEVRYDCVCGYHPVARYTRGSSESGHEHCCCGIVHFAGGDADANLRRYLDERKTQGADPPGAVYEIERAAVDAPWGERLSVAWGAPRRS